MHDGWEDWGWIVIFTARRLEASARSTRLRGNKAVAAGTVFSQLRTVFTRDNRSRELKESLKTSLNPWTRKRDVLPQHVSRDHD